MWSLPNLIIGGTNKAGTTSLFRYLAAHPHACASAVKEPRFFSHHRDPLSADALAAYATQFRHCSTDNRVVFEASPQYLAGGLIVARRINEAIPDVRLVFVLRRPADRLMSFYNSYVSKDNPLAASLSPSLFVEKVLEIADLPANQLNADDSQLQRELLRGCYHLQLHDYLSIFPRERMLVLFFEDLASDPRLTMRRLCAFAGLEFDFYAEFAFTVENKTRRYRSAFLSRIAHSLNLHLETTFNRHPRLRAGVRGIYTVINERGPPPVGGNDALARLDNFYRPFTRKLAILMKETWPDQSGPEWLVGK